MASHDSGIGRRAMIQLLIGSPLLLLFLVAAIGYPFGRIKIAGSSLGVSAVLFAGLAVGSLHPDLKLPELVYELGLVLFVYTVGLSSGRQFFASFRRKGWRDNLLTAVLLAVIAGLSVVAGLLLGLRPALTSGLFIGSSNNNAALAAAIDYLRSYAPQASRDAMVADLVVGFSITYPMGIVGMIVVITLLQRRWKIDYAAEAQQVRDLPAVRRTLDSTTIRVTRTEATTAPLGEQRRQYGWDVIFGRMRRDGQLSLAGDGVQPRIGDLISVNGTPEEMERVTAWLGEMSPEHLAFDRDEYDFRRMFVSSPSVAGRRLRDLHLPLQWDAVVTLVRRGDVDMLAYGDTVLELGDRVRVVTRRKNIPTVGAFFGDSYRALSEIDILTFNLGLALGLLVGMVPIPLPGGIVLKLGIAGGPLVMALVLGAIGRTGPLLWNIPYSANLTLRQLGLVLFLAGVGTRSGYALVTTMQQGGALPIFLAGTAIVLITALLTLWVGRLLNIPMGLLIGLLSGLQTQPAILSFALEQTGDELPNIGYAAVFPVALIGKILLAQLLLAVLR